MGRIRGSKNFTRLHPFRKVGLFFVSTDFVQTLRVFFD